MLWRLPPVKKREDLFLKSNQGQQKVSARVSGAPSAVQRFLGMSLLVGITAEARYHTGHIPPADKSQIQPSGRYVRLARTSACLGFALIGLLWLFEAETHFSVR